MAASTSLSVALLFLGLTGGVLAFKPFFSTKNSFTHRYIQEMAVLRKTAEVCRALALAEGKDFNLPLDDSLTASRVLEACLSSGGSSTLSAYRFKGSIVAMYLSNGLVDLLHLLSAEHHFDDETFVGGRRLITVGMSSVKASIRENSFFSARLTLGKICHTLHDFYSHSNWIELGNKVPYSKLIQADSPIGNLADKDTPTCRNCEGENCQNNILPTIIEEKKLTSGYFSLSSSSKPTGKCSHGGFFDKTSRQEPVGGINKDDFGASHGHLHEAAALLALNATMELLEDIRGAAGDKDFLQLMGISRSSVLCFVIDTTGSMADDIAEAKRVAFSIIDRKRGTQDEPSGYILVPFNDPDFGPLIRTTDANIFKKKIEELNAAGGGDTPEMCLSGLQLALTGAPPSSEIFVFTDAPAKDISLKSTVTALIESTNSVVTFLLTDAFSVRRKRSIVSKFQLYHDLAQVSGGQAIEVTKTTLPQATDIIVDSSTSALVTILQCARDPAVPELLSFLVDASVSNLTIYITGSSLVFTLFSPSGGSQQSVEGNGPLGSINAVGNLYRVQLNHQVGSWKIVVVSSKPYTLKVTGQSATGFIYSFINVTPAGEDVTLTEGRPQTGGNATLLLSVTSSSTVNLTGVSLVGVSGSEEVNGTLESVGQGDFLVNVDRVPDGLFSVLLKGEIVSSSRSSTTPFQRQSNTQLRASRISVTAETNSTLEPEKPFSLPFTLTAPHTTGTAGNYNIRARDNRGFITSFTNSLALVSDGGSAQGLVSLLAPSSTPSGTDIILTIEAESPDASDSNYAVLRLSVLEKVTDFSRPECQVISVSANCSENCTISDWELSANLSDGNGTGIQTISIRQGNGTLNSTTVLGDGGINITMVTYSASCCYPEVMIVAVDAVGNVGTCFHSIKATTTAEPPSTTTSSVTKTPTMTASSDSSSPMFSPFLGLLLALWHLFKNLHS